VPGTTYTLHTKSFAFLRNMYILYMSLRKEFLHTGGKIDLLEKSPFMRGFFISSVFALGTCHQTYTSHVTAVSV
jgi:hypothetical protein